MTEDTAHCLFCNQPTELTHGRTEDSPGQFIGCWITNIELEDAFGLKESREGKGCMFICRTCRERMHTAIENNAKLASQ
ncbi:hypothetical protein M0R72_18465 [Candidatus Pacearchaeota archaeon]|nr:hypothetical protein [Candidatus Pacearchaeota archaeon]